jgi:hypothetical protein
MSGGARETYCTWTTKRHARFEVSGHSVTGDRATNSKGAGWEYASIDSR